MNILTFDIEEWFHILDHKYTKTEKQWDDFEYRIESNLERILELLEKKNQKATFFCLGWIAKKFPNILRKIDCNNYEIGSHSNLHTLAYDQTRNEFKKDLLDSIKNIEDIIGKKVIYYRAPGFSLINKNKWVFEELIEAGIEIDCSIFPAKRSHGGFLEFPSNHPSIIKIRDKKIKEFPINTFDFAKKNIIFSGGGYFRLFPYFLIYLLTKRSDYLMTYFHPRDFDVNQPIIKTLNTYRRFKSYYGIKSAFCKLERLISDFDFIDIFEANKLVKWDKNIEINYENL